MENKLIREGRFGPPKCWKTGAVVSTYPRPLLTLEVDKNGLDVINEPIVELTPEELIMSVKLPRSELPPLSFVDISKLSRNDLPMDLNMPPNAEGWPGFHKVAKTLITSCPYRTVVIDSFTSLQKLLYGYIVSTSPAQLADARKWAFTIGQKVDQVISAFAMLPNTHVVFIFHEDQEKNELTSEINTNPMLYSKLRLYTGGILSQFFYQKMEGGKAVLYTQATGFVKGIGARWPDLMNRPKITPPTFNEIYGKDVK